MEGNQYARTIPLSRTTKFIVDNRGKTVPTVEKGIALIATNCVTNNHLYPLKDKLRFISQETYDTWFRAHPEPGDILLTNKGSQNGAICLVPDPVDFVIAQDMVAIRANEEVIDPLFLFAALRCQDVQDQIKNLDVSGVIPHFKKGDFDKLHLPYPERHIQKKIGRIYFELSKKIELNRRMNETLEAIARMFFKDWFVDFGPTRAKAEGRTAYLAPELWSLFPAALDDDDKPMGWKIESIGNYIVNFDSKRVPVAGAERAMRKGVYPYHGATSVMDYIDDYLFDGIFLLIGEDGSVAQENGMAFTQYVSGKIWVNNHAHVLQGKGAVTTEQLYMYFHFESVEPYVTGAVQLKLSQGRMNLMPFMFPGDEICQAFGNVVSPLFAQLRANIDENKTLIETRDLLLPKLMSGEIRLREAEKMVGQAA